MILPRGGETTCIKRKLSSSWEILKEPLRGTNFLFCGRDSSRFTRKRSRLKTITSRHIFWSECHKMYRKRYDELPRPFCMGVPTRPSFVAETIFFKEKNGYITTHQEPKEICFNYLLPLTPTYYISLQEMSCSPVPMILDACIEITIMTKRSVYCCLLNCNFDIMYGCS